MLTTVHQNTQAKAATGFAASSVLEARGYPQGAPAFEISPRLQMQSAALEGFRNGSRLGEQQRSIHAMAPTAMPQAELAGTLQRKVLPPAALGGGVASAGKAAIFSSTLVSQGPLYSKTVPIGANDAETAIAAYQKEIIPIGQAARAATNTTKVNPDAYTDKAQPNPVGQLGGVVSSAFRAKVGELLVATAPQLNSLGLTANLPKAAAAPLLNTLFNGREALLGNDDVGLVDPFVVRLNLHQGSHVKGEEDWSVDTQFASTAGGYIVRIVDGKNAVTGSIVSPEEFAGTAKNVAATQSTDFIYSSTHEQDGGAFGERVETLDRPASAAKGRNGKRISSGLPTRDAHANAFDAVTWIAAEGARFKPVAELGGKATPETNFYTIPDREDGWRNVTLNWLMSNWGARFKRSYGISRDFIARVAAEFGTPMVEMPAKPRYNLDDGTID